MSSGWSLPRMPAADGKKKSLRWDEENLDYNEENKTPKMKIDEPPTPFNFDYCDDEPADGEIRHQGAHRKGLSMHGMFQLF